MNPTGTQAQRVDEARHASAAAPHPASPGIDLAQLTGSRCRWPVAGDGADLRYCGAPKPELARPYCEAHRRVATKQPAPSRAKTGAVRA